MAFRFKLMAFPIKLTQNDTNQGKKYFFFENFELQPLLGLSKICLAFLIL
jgi:hypothetical protein